MGLLSFFKRQTESSANAPSVADASDAVQQARTRARRRLIGAVVLLGIGIIGFPLVFETQPRPIPVNIPIETPAKEGAPALTMPAARSTAPAPSPSSAATTAAKPIVAAPAEVIAESRQEAAPEAVAAPTPAPAPAPAASKPSAPKPAASKPAAAPAPAVATATAKPADAARAQALLEGKPSRPAKADDADEAGRFVVQVGAFADVAAAHETRLKVEKLGLKTYTQVATTSAGKRIRVRAGPYNSRADADKALAKAKAAGLTAVVLTL